MQSSKSIWIRVAEKLGLSAISNKLQAILKRQNKAALTLVKIIEKFKEYSGGGQGVDKGTQLLLSLKYQDLARSGTVLPFHDVEFRNFSQNGEDGILHYIFALIGTTNKRCIEICAGTGIECNCTNLILNHGWNALLIDGQKGKVERGLKFFSGHPDSTVLGPRFLHRWITRDNVNDIFSEADFTGEIDLLSLDMDGFDYWVFEAIEVIKPRVVILEFMPQLGLEPLTVPYSENFETEWIPLFSRDDKTGEQLDDETPEDLSFFGRWTMYGGASLPAFNKLAKQKGYRLIGANSIGFNAFFIRNDIANDLFPEVTEQSCFNENARTRLDRANAKIKGMDWERV